MNDLSRVTADDRGRLPGAEGRLSKAFVGGAAPHRPDLPLIAAMIGSRLCRRVALAIFLCLIAIEALIQGPAYRNFERSLVTRLEESALASVISLFRLTPEGVAHQQVISAAAALLTVTPLKGGALYGEDGTLLGTFGEAPELRYGPGVIIPDSGRYARDCACFEVAWMRDRIGAPFVFVARLDSSWIAPQLEAFLLRVGLVTLGVALVLTAATMTILGLTVLAPILALRRRLAMAGADLEHADRHTVPVDRHDELGEVLEDFNRLLGHITRSIAELRRSHTEIRASEERWRRIFDCSADAVLIVCWHTMRILDANETAIRLFEYGRSDLLGRTVDALEGEQGCLTRLIEAASRQGNAGSDVVTCMSRSGRRILAEAQLASLPIDPGWQMLLVVRDMTERRLAEEALRLSQRRLAGILDIAQDAIISVDDTRTIRLFNKGAERIFGFAAYETIGRPMELLLPDSRSLVKGIERREPPPPPNGAAEPLEVRARRKDGAEFPAELTASKFQLGEETVLTIILRDISDRRRAEMERAELLGQFHHAQKMEAIGRLAGGIAHDFNNVLAAILGYADLAAYDLPANTPATANVQQVLKAARRGKTLVRQILAFSRREEKIERPVHVDQVLREAIDLLSATLPKTIEIEQRIDAQPAVVRADEAEIHQLVMNLCVNAGQAIGEKAGRITIELALASGPECEASLRANGARLVAGAFGTGPYVRVGVGDTGIGMDEDTVSHMFEPFFTTKPKGEGTGLGLAAVHGIVSARHGAIAVRTAPGAGTRIDIFLRSCTGEDDCSESRTANLAADGERVLFVDDEPELADIGCQLLERLGYGCDAMSSATAALAAFRANPDRWSVVITDHIMPGMTGEAMAREMLTIRPGLPIILCSGFGETVTSQFVKASGIREFAMKPVSGQELAEMISRVLRSRPTSSSAA